MYKIIILFAILVLLFIGIYSFGMAAYLGAESLKDRRDQKRQSTCKQRDVDSPLDSVKSAKPLTQTRWQR